MHPCPLRRSRLGVVLALAVLSESCHPHDRARGEPDGQDARRRIGARVSIPADAGARLVRRGSGSAKVTLQSNAHLIERDEALTRLAGVSHDGSTLLFTAPSPALRALHAGDVLVIRGLLARKVLAVEAEGSSIAFLTTPASIGDVVRDGQIRLDTPVRFTPAPTQHAWLDLKDPLERLLALAVPPAQAQGVADRLKDAESKGRRDALTGAAKGALKGIYSGWTTTYSAAPGAGRVDISLQMTKEVGGFKGVVTGTGYLADFDLSSRIDVRQGALDRLEVSYKRVNGLMNFSWEVGKDTPGGYSESDRIKLPGALSIPLYQLLDGFPLYLEVSAAIIVQPVITGGQQYSHGAFRINYDGAEGFQAKKGNIDPDGSVHGDIKFLEDRHISALAPVGMVLNLAAPRVELTMNPLKVLSDIQGGGLQEQMEDAAGKVDKIAKLLVKRTLGSEAAERMKTAGFSMTKATDAMKSDAMAYLQLVATNSVTNSGLSVITPCTHTELALSMSVGASAQAFGQEVGSVGKQVFERKFTRIDPPGTRLCEY
jgi:hypothetical protein